MTIGIPGRITALAAALMIGGCGDDTSRNASAPDAPATEAELAEDAALANEAAAAEAADMATYGGNAAAEQTNKQ